MSARRDWFGAIAMLVLATPCWAVSFPVMKALALEQQKLLPDTDSWFLTALGVAMRFGASGLLTLPLLFRRGAALTRLEAEQGLVLAAFGGAGILFQMDGLAYTAASTSAFLTQGYTVFIPLWVMLTTRRLPSLKLISSIALVVLGVAALAGVKWQSLNLGRGEIETVIASVMFTGQILALEQPRYQANRPTQFSVVMFLAMALFGACVAWAKSPAAGAAWRAYSSPAAWSFMAVLVVVCTLAGYLIMNRWQRRVTATEAGLIYCIEPVFASIMALFLPGLFSRWAGISYANETLTLRLMTGGGLIILANGLLHSRWLDSKPVAALKREEAG